MKPLFHIDPLPRLVAPRPARTAGAPPPSANRHGQAAPTAWLTSFTPWRPAPFLRVPPVAEDAGRQAHEAGHAAAPVRRENLLLRAERLRTLGR